MARIHFINALCLAGHVSAQNNSSYRDCPVTIRNIATENWLYNSTGTLPIEFEGQDDSWQISVTVTDRRAPNLWFGDRKSDQETNTYLSVPESLIGSEKGNETFICLYMMPGFNQTATNATEADDSCEGILGDECVEKFEKTPTADGQKCPTVSASEKCGRFVASQLTPLNFSSSRCTLDELPSIDLPENYKTFGGLPGSALLAGDRELDEYDAYDLRVRQPIPLLLTAQSGDSRQSKMALNILLNNDDGFGSANLRETYRLLKGKGHNVWIVAPATKQSGKGGASDFTTEGNLTAPSMYDLIPKGAPSVGSDPKDSQIWYYNGTPAACTFVALDYVLPRYANFSVPDLIVTGPNFGTNLGGFVWTLSGTAGAAYAATNRGIPAIAISASNQETPYTELTNRTNPATWAAEAAVKFVDNFISTAPKTGPLLPTGYGVNVNIPVLTKKNHDPAFVQTRFTGNAHVNEAVLDKEKGTFTWANIKPYAAGVNACINGDCSLPGETYVVENGQASVSFYTVDYSAPSTAYTQSLIKRVASFISSDK
ncbi:hypothetical protein ACHAPA_009719 [Fusarium lateritium]